jgi:glycine hydroxymethyltransferase
MSTTNNNNNHTSSSSPPTIPGNPNANKSLEEHDPILYDLIQKEATRQYQGLELIASENIVSKFTLDALGSCLVNKYAEGLPGARYYGGNDVIDQIERLCQERALAAYKLDANQWGVNVQPYSGSPANFAVYTALLKPHDRIMGLDLPSGGHLTHGFYTTDKDTKQSKAISATSLYFESLPYRVSSATGLVDFDSLAQLADLFKPKMIVCGGSAYPREWDYKRFREIADSCGALLMTDMAHISGLVAAGCAASPFEYSDIVTTTTHKTMRGPRSGMIFYKKDTRNFEAKINWAVFPALQGGPHEHQIAGVATQLLEVATPTFHKYARQIVSNCKALATALMAKGNTLATGGTDNHLILWDLRPHKLTGNKMELVCDLVHITLNKNAVFGDRSALSPGGVRIGTPALTSRGFVEKDMETVAELLDRAKEIALSVQSKTKTLAEFKAELEKGSPELTKLRNDVHMFAKKFGMPGFDVTKLKYQ